MKFLRQSLASAHPVQVDPCGDGVGVHANFGSPIAEILRSPIVSNKPCSARVAILIGFSCPPAVLWGVAKVVVDSIKGQPCGAFSHISQKVFKSQPAVAYRNSSAAVLFKSFIKRLVAPSTHVKPCFIRLCWLVSFGSSVRRISSGRQFSTKAPAGIGSTINQATSRDAFLSAAVADAKAAGGFALPRQLLNNKSAKASANERGIFFVHKTL